MRSGAKAYLKKLVRMRKKLMQGGHSRRHPALIYGALKPLEAWLKAYPNASDSAATKVIRANYGRIIALIPGSGSTAGPKLMQELDEILNAQTSLNI